MSRRNLTAALGRRGRFCDPDRAGGVRLLRLRRGRPREHPTFSRQMSAARALRQHGAMADDDAKCVYVLGSESHPGRFYTGLTSDLTARLAAHNRGEFVHTASGCPWRVVVAVVFADPARAKAFERYLKSVSGRAFAERYFR